jgi:hypothetical protein
MDSAKSRMNQLKDVFRDIRPIDNDTLEGHFNFPKFHSLTHFVPFIRLYGAPDGYNTSIPESLHKGIKESYSRTNKRTDFLAQMCRHNIRSVNVSAMVDIELWRASGLNNVADRMDVESNYVTREHQTIQCQLTQAEKEELPLYISSQKMLQNWRHSSRIQEMLGLDGFVDALAVFVRETRKKMDNEKSPWDDSIERDSSWVNTYPVAMHRSLRYWKRDGKDASDINRLVSEWARCAFEWQGQKECWRRDFIWIWASPLDQGVVNGKLLGQLQLLFSVLDLGRRDERGRPIRYTGAFVDIFKVKNPNNPRLHKIHGMYEYNKQPFNQATQRRTLGSRRSYALDKIHRAAHVVPAQFSDSNHYLVNNYIDWEQYNDLHDDNWEAENIQAANKAGRQLAKEYTTHVRNLKPELRRGAGLIQFD